MKEAVKSASVSASGMYRNGDVITRRRCHSIVSAGNITVTAQKAVKGLLKWCLAGTKISILVITPVTPEGLHARHHLVEEKQVGGREFLLKCLFSCSLTTLSLPGTESDLYKHNQSQKLPYELSRIPGNDFPHHSYTLGVILISGI